MVTAAEQVVSKGIALGPGRRTGGPNGKGPGGNGNGSGPHHGGFSPERYRIGMWVAIAAITMMFTALTSAYIVRAAGSSDWQPLHMPRILLLSTAMIIASSASFAIAIKRLVYGNQTGYTRWLLGTLLLGLGFLVSQLAAWQNLRTQGIYLSSNPHSAFFYLLTALHGLHLVGGVIALGFLFYHAVTKRTPGEIGPRRLTAARTIGIYWHFMDALWVYLFLLLFLWR